MVYPHGNIALNRYFKILDSKEYVIWFEDTSGNKTQIANVSQLYDSLKKEHNSEGTICYDFTDLYWEKHPYCGEERDLTNHKKFTWEWQSFCTHKCYSIMGDISHLELCVYDDNDFNSTRYVVGYFENNKDFKTVENRFFEIPEDDIVHICKALNTAYNFLETCERK